MILTASFIKIVGLLFPKLRFDGDKYLSLGIFILNAFSEGIFTAFLPNKGKEMLCTFFSSLGEYRIDPDSSQGPILIAVILGDTI
jgi:hypothetical protein|mmetsp:Transcript_12361/g.1845  ORF Transcript_12361/g.1845 Transcript_12361/m.1845 type:complete len:85 (+) Transcript_12361:3384-3638(+)